MPKIFAVSDIHGCYKTLKKAIEQINISQEDKIIFLGDYIDRGPASKDVIDYLIKLKEKYDCIFLMGNHEEMLLNVLNDKSSDNFAYQCWAFNGGMDTLKSYQIGPYPIDMPTKLIDFLNGLSLYFQTKKHIFVHAGLKPGVKIEDQEKDDLLWIRDEFISSNYNFGKKVVFGHTPGNHILHDNYKIGIDTGCVYPSFGNLTILEILEENDWYRYHRIPNCDNL